jgi:hypothetical protein
MTVTATALADGSGDGQFDDPLGIFYYNSEVFVADYDNSRISVWTVSGETLTYARKYDLGYKPMDLCFDGTNWYVQSEANTYKYDNVFTDATKTSTVCVGYSLTIVPDQSDGNGATLAISNNSGNCLYRRKCSDLSLVATIGSSGDGSASLFDPTFTTSVPTTVTYQMDDGFTYTTPLGTSHAISWNGFAGYTFRNDGPHRCTARVPLGLVTALVADSDAIVEIRNLARLANIGSLSAYTNNNLVLRLRDIPRKTITVSVSPSVALTTITDRLLDLPQTVSTLLLSRCTAVSGTVSDLPSGIQVAWLFYDSGLLPGSIAAFVALQDLRAYGMGWSTAQNTTVLLSAWNARAAYTYASGIQLRIGAPTGTPGTEPPAEGESNADWSWNAETSRHDPLTGYAVMADLQEDFYSEGFNLWNVTII